jgi:hypothetical protein
MRRINRVMALAALCALTAVGAIAQAKECTEEFKTATYSKWYDNRVDHQDVAYEAATQYVTVCPDDTSPYAVALKKFKEKYEQLQGTQKVATQFDAAVKSKNYAEQIRLGKQIVATNPENGSVVYIIMAGAGLGDANLLPESANAAKKAIELIEGGKPFAPAYTSKDQALAAMNYIIAKSAMKTAPADAIPSFLKAARYESDLKKSWQFYFELADAYDKGPIAKLTADYKSKIGPNNTETPESKLALENLFAMIDRQIDALARAAALADATNKQAITADVTELYKYRNKSDAGLTELLASVLTKPIPDMPTPITQVPAPAPAATPTPGTGSTSGGANGGATGGAAPGGTAGSSAPKTTAGSTTPTGSSSAPAKPAASPKPKPRRSNHRGH